MICCQTAAARLLIKHRETVFGLAGRGWGQFEQRAASQFSAGGAGATLGGHAIQRAVGIDDHPRQDEAILPEAAGSLLHALHVSGASGM